MLLENLFVNLIYLTNVDNSIFAPVNVNERVARLMRPRLHYSGHVHPAGYSVGSTCFLVNEIPQIRAIGNSELAVTMQRNSFSS